MATIVLSDLTAEFPQFVNQLEDVLANQPVWKGTLTTQTSQTLIEMISTVGTLDQAKIIRAYEDCFSETAQSDMAIRSIVQMQGLRMSRKMPAVISVELFSGVELTLPPLTQFTGAGMYWFNKEQILLEAGVAKTIELSQGQIVTWQVAGLGTILQSFASPETDFVVSDADVQVKLNGMLIEKNFGGLWNNKGEDAYADLTMADGRLLVQFGNDLFGTVPQVNDIVEIKYAVTMGNDANNKTTFGKKVSITGFSGIEGNILSNPTGGSDDKPVLVYKNVAAGSFGTYSSGVTDKQYKALVVTYPGIVDAAVQAQREINTMALQWMNVFRISALTESPWTQTQKDDFIKYMQKITMYSGRFVWQNPIAIPREVDVDVYCFNSAILSQVKADVEDAITKFFAPQPGLLMTNFYESDLISLIKKTGKGLVSYVVVNKPTQPMMVTAPSSPPLSFTTSQTGGSLTELIYAYGVSVNSENGDLGTPSNWVFPQLVGTSTGSVTLTWEPGDDVVNYRVWGRKAGGIGLLAVLPPETLTFTDNGSIVPNGDPPNSVAEVPIRYNSLSSLTVRTQYSERQKRLSSDGK